MTQPSGEQQSATSAPQPAIDGSRLESLHEVDPSLVTEIAELWLDTTPALLRQLSDAAQAGDSAGVAVAAHALRGSSANMGADSLAEACGRVEAAVRDGGEVQELMAPVVAEHARAIAELEVIAGRRAADGNPG